MCSSDLFPSHDKTAATKTKNFILIPIFLFENQFQTIKTKTRANLNKSARFKLQSEKCRLKSVNTNINVLCFDQFQWELVFLGFFKLYNPNKKKKPGLSSGYLFYFKNLLLRHRHHLQLDIVQNQLPLTLDFTEVEGFVMRNTNSFRYLDFQKNVAKFVRKGHVQTDQHWMSKPVVKNLLKDDSI